MGALKGLGAIKREVARQKEEQENRLSVRWLKLEDGQSVKIRFVNEADSDSAEYDPERGVAVAIEEHQNPKDYKRKAACTLADQGRCYGCEMNQKREKGWYPRTRFYINVLVNDGQNEPYVAVWSMGVRRSAAFDTINEYFAEAGAISNLEWRLRRNGEGTDTTYTLLPGKVDTEPFDWSGVEPIDLEKVVRDLPYADQEAFYMGFDAPATSANDAW
jgi:hypothetical protein